MYPININLLKKTRYPKTNTGFVIREYEYLHAPS